MAETPHRYYKKWSELNDNQKAREGSKDEFIAAKQAAGLKGVTGGYEEYQKRMAGDAVVEEAAKPAPPQVNNINDYDNYAYGAGSQNKNNTGDGAAGNRFSAADIRNLDQQGYSYDEIKQFADESVAGGTKMGGAADAVMAELAARSSGPSGPTNPTGPAPTAPATPGPTNPGPTNPAPTYPAPTYPGPSNPAPTYPGPTNPAPTYPGPSNPTPTYPGPTNPAPTPGPTNPTPVGPAPVPTYPTPTNPGPTYPAPAYPSPTNPINNEQDQEVNTDQDVDQTIDQEVNNRNDVDNSAHMENNSVNNIDGNYNWINNAMYHFGGNTTINNWSDLNASNNNSQSVDASQGFGGWGSAGPDGTTAGVQSDLDDWANGQGFGWSNDANSLMSKKAMGHSLDFDSPADAAKFVSQYAAINDMVQNDKPRMNHAAQANEAIAGMGIDNAAMHQFTMQGAQNALDRSTILGSHIFGDMFKFQAPDWESSLGNQPAPERPDLGEIGDKHKDDMDDLL